MKRRQNLKKLLLALTVASVLPLSGCGNLVTMTDEYLAAGATLPPAAGDADVPVLSPTAANLSDTTAAASAASDSAAAQTAAAASTAASDTAAAQTAAASAAASDTAAAQTAAASAAATDSAAAQAAAASTAASDTASAQTSAASAAVTDSASAQAAAASAAATDSASAQAAAASAAAASAGAVTTQTAVQNPEGDGLASASQSAADANPEGDGIASASQSAADANPEGDASDVLPQSPLYEEYSIFIPKLTADELTDFYAIYSGLMAFEEQIELPVPLTSSEVETLMQLMIEECPELLQMGSSWQQNTDLLSNVHSVIPSYNLTRDEMISQYTTIQALISSFHSQLDGYDGYQAELAVTNYIIENCAYSVDAEYASTAFGALIAGAAKCDGRAKALVWVLRSFGIESSVVTGSDHAWVVLNLDGTYCNTDPTYDDNETNGVQHTSSYAFFNVPESAIADDPYPADKLYTQLGIPETVSWAQNYHVRSGCWISAGSDASALFKAQADAALQAGTGIINIRFESAEDYAAAKEASSSWLSECLNWNAASCQVTTFDYSDQNILFMVLDFS
ncbi:MAG: transglutaminase domain-containing protein [Lachnospiraceae bacterium]|jgi:transglutaminase-like putative cysteine protease